MSSAPAPTFADATQVRSRPVRRLGRIGCAYVTGFAAAAVAWLTINGVAASLWLIAPGLLVPAVAFVLMLRSTADARQYTMNVLAATLALPVVLLIWADSFELPAPAASARVAAEPPLDAQRLFQGAVATQDSDLRNSQGPLLRAATFADGSELRLTRYADPQAAAAYLAMLASTFRGEPFSDGGRRAIRLLNAGAGSTLVLVEQHGADLLELRSRDPASGLARLVMQQVPAPADSPAASATAAARTAALPQWPFYAGAATLHLLFFAGLIVWGGSALTQVPALAGTVAVSAEALSDRLCSLARASDRLVVSTPVPGSLLFDVRVGQRRSHRITLRLDAGRLTVRVGEKIAAGGAAPIDDGEASMGDFGESSFDATRPDAQRVWSSTWQATMIEPARLASVPMQLQATSALLPAAYLDSLDGEGVLTVLCAIVIRSGWHWQPRLLPATHRSSGRPT
ncbi:MAG TPA: hypothetical protein VJN68_16330 [Burkholderiaceae bacterium]|nr:hypothetical protein [Burkholderiaceae bacterium]